MKTALITGSTRGIGRQIGLDLIHENHYVYFNGRSYQFTEQDKISQQYRYGRCNVCCYDLSTLDGNLQLSYYLKSQDIRLDVLVLNLGITDRTPFGAICYDSWMKVMNTNLNFPFFLIQSLSSHIKEGGKIIFISSISGCIADSISISYGASKSAVNMIVPYLAKELASKNITVNAVAPGYIDTEWHENKAIEQIHRIEKKCLVRRLGTTKEVSKSVMSIIENDFINGQVLRVDGGFGL